MSSQRLPGWRRTPRIHRPSVLALEGRLLLAGSPRVDLFALPSLAADPGPIVDGPDGALWFAEGSGRIGRIDPQGRLTEFPLPTPAGGTTPVLSALANGPDGAIWGVDGINGQVDRITPDGRVQSFAAPGKLDGIDTSIVSGPDGNLWFSFGAPSRPEPAAGPGTIDRITPQGVVTAFPLSLGGFYATSLVAGPAGVWFTDPAAGRVGKVDASGHVVETGGPIDAPFYDPDTALSGDHTLAVGPDGDAYYLAQGGTGSFLVRISAAGATTPIALPDSYSAWDLVTGSDGVYVLHADQGGPAGLARLGPDGTVTTVSSGITPASSPASGLAFGPDGNAWFTERGPALIGRVVLTSAPVPEPGPTLVSAGPAAPPVASGGQGPDLVAPIGQSAAIDLAGFRHSADVSGLAATVDWGDGSAPTLGDLGPVPKTSADYGPFPFAYPFAYPGADPFVDGEVSGTHAYAEAGSYTVTISIQGTGPGGIPITTEVVESVTAVAPTPVPRPPLVFRPGKAIAFQGVVAEFSTPTTHDTSGSDFSATIDWGDGSVPSAGAVAGVYGGPTLFEAPPSEPDSLFKVTGGHTYATSGPFTVRVTLTDQFGHSATSSTPIEVAPGRLSIQPKSPAIATVAPFHDALGSNNKLVDLGLLTDLLGDRPPQAYSVTVDWGDGSAPTAGLLEALIYLESMGGERPGFAIGGSHAYAQAGDYTVHLTVADGRGDSAEATVTARASVPKLEVDPSTLLSAAVGVPIPVMSLASILPPKADEGAADFTATVDWGDGSTPTAGTISPARRFDDTFTQRFDVSGGHTYAGPGLYDVMVSVVGPDGSTARSASLVSVSVVAAQQFFHPDTPLAFSTGAASGPRRLESFSAYGATAADFRASVDWGDGSPAQPATIQVNPPDQSFPGEFQVLAGHSYARPGNYAVRLTVVGPDGRPDVINLRAVVFDPIFTASPPIVGLPANPPATAPVPSTSTPAPVSIPDTTPTSAATPTPNPEPTPEPAPTPIPGSTPVPASTPDLTPATLTTPSPSPILTPSAPPPKAPSFPMALPVPFVNLFPIAVPQFGPVGPMPAHHAAHKLAHHHRAARPAYHHAATSAKQATHHASAKLVHAPHPRKHPAGPARIAKPHR